MSIALEVPPVLSYPMAHNEIPVISRLTVSGAPRYIQSARLRLEVSDASGAIAHPTEIFLDLLPGEQAVLTDTQLRLTLDPSAMLQIEEQRPGTVRAQLEVDGQVCADEVARVRVLAAHQWRSWPTGLAMEMLAAHVLPNHPAVAVLMREVTDQLQLSTSSPSLEGYQSGPERVDEIVRAVYVAMQARGIAYAEPPASWADEGQKVRTPGEVLDGRVGTCLDTVVVMAAALEQAGIRPLIWVVDGHAFLGYWREEISLGAVVEFEPRGVVNRVELKQMSLVETTALTRRSESVDVAEAQRLPYDTFLTGDLHQVVGVVDVHQARLSRILPLPARVRDAEGNTQVITYTPSNPGAGGPIPGPMPAGRSPRATVTEPPRVTRWKNALLDLSLRNQLINFSNHSALSLTIPDDGLGVLEDLLHRSTAFTLRPLDALAEVDRERGLHSARELPHARLTELLGTRHIVHIGVTEAAYTGRLRNLAHKARTIVEETGANNLYLALGMLAWEFDGRTLRSPLILVPVVLKAASRGGAYRLTLDESGASTPNYCLIEKLRQVHGVDIPGLTEPATDGAGIDIDATFAETRRAIAERGMHFRVEPTVDLAVLQFAKFRLWKDLDENWSAFEHNSLVKHLVQTPTEAFTDPTESELTAPVFDDLDGLDEDCPVAADSSQLQAIAHAVAGRTFVLEGPPGTGKSQTITNLLAHAVAQQKRVLFVAEKRAALDVVQRRLDQIGMGPLCLDLHDKGTGPVAVREQITRALDLVIVADTQGHSDKVEELRSARRGLSRYVHDISNNGNAARLSLYRARDAALSVADDVTPVTVPEMLLKHAAPDTVEALRRLFSTLPDVADLARPHSHHPWRFIDRAGNVDVSQARQAVQRLEAVSSKLPGELGPALAAARLPEDLHILGTLVGARVPLHVLDEVPQPRWSKAVEEMLAKLDQYAAAEHPGLDIVTPDALELPVAEIDEAARLATASGFIGRKKRLVAVGQRLAPVLRAGAAVVPKRLTELTAALLGLRAEVDELVAEIETIPGLRLGQTWNPFSVPGRCVLNEQIDWLRWAARQVDPSSSEPDRSRFAEPLRAALHSGGHADPRPVLEAASAAEELANACAVHPAALAAWAGELGLLGRWRATATDRASTDAHLESLRRWLDLLSHLEPLRSAGLGQARDAVLDGTLDPDNARRSFDLGLATAAVQERLHTMRLASFDPVAHERAIARFGTASRGVREHLATVLPQRVVTGRDFDPTSVGGQIGQLRRQLKIRRGGMRVRELMIKYGELVTRVLPCVLVSPDSLARFFPAQADLFDIVVFDEASQVRVADAVGAMGRARSVVVVGDSKQMPPTSFADSSHGGDSTDPDTAEEQVEDEESILTECVQARVKSHRLTWHYRSQDESLIAFSNRHYYEDTLSSFPSPAGTGAAVSLVRVDGHYHRSGRGALLNTNPVEAVAIVAEIQRRFDASPVDLPSLGVVTFNQKQRAYIEGLLRDADDPRLTEALDNSDGLFIKNLENVQGDERDVVLFSTAFSVNDRGVLPLNFGPLLRAGGERRLNVAVTRARRQVVVFCSFDPSQLRVEDTSSVGIKHLRSYLEMAANGPSALPRDVRRQPTPDRHRDQIAARLAERGLAVRTHVGLSEFTLDLVLAERRAPDKALVAVLLDGPNWASRRTARDRDSLPQEILAGVLGWPRVERVWLPNWLADPDTVTERLVTSVWEAAAEVSRGKAKTKTAKQVRPPVTPVAATPSANERLLTSTIAHGLPPVIATPNSGHRQVVDVAWPHQVEVFVSWPIHQFGDIDVLDALPSPTAAGKVTAALLEVITAEGPIHTDRLARLVANGFGLAKVMGTRKSAILRHLPSTVRKDQHESVVWPILRDPENWSGYRSTPEKIDRPLEHVPLCEIANAMAASTRAAAGFQRDELFREVVRLFARAHVTASVAKRFTLALDIASRAGKLHTSPDGLITAVESGAATAARSPEPSQ
jgi:lambda repressor-like predicted transcriptional regulator